MPDWSREVRTRLSSLGLSPTREAEIVEELSQHLDDRWRELIAGGASPESATQLTLADFRDGNVLGRHLASLRQTHPPLSITPGAPAGRLLGDLWQDLRYAGRMLRKSPGFTVVAALSLSIGIGANSAIFSLIRAALFRPFPVERPAEVAAIYTSDFSGPPFGASSYPDYLDFRDKTTVFAGLSAWRTFPAVVNVSTDTERANGTLATGNYFQLLGVGAALGRVFTPSEDAQAVAVLSDRFWQRLGGQPGIVNETIRVNGQPFTVVGIAPPEFTGLQANQTDFWVPAGTLLQITPGSNALNARNSRGWRVVGRLAEGTTIQQAQAALSVVAGQLARSYPNTWIDLRRQPRRVTITPASRVAPNIRSAVVGFMTLLMSVVGLVLLIACANVANLLLARAAARRREIAIRLSIGASRGRLVRQLLTESIVLSLLAGAAGLAVALWIVNIVAAFKAPTLLPVPLDAAIDVRVLFFTFTLSIATAVLFGLAPALQSTRPGVVLALKSDSGLSVARRRLHIGHLLVAGQLALSLVVLVAAGLLIRTLQQSQTINLGFDPDNIAIMSVDLTGTGQADPVRSEQIFTAIVNRLKQFAHVERASLAAFVALGPSSRSRQFVAVEGYELRPGEDAEQHYNVVTPDYFETMRIPIVRGRAFDDRDRVGAPGVAMINETFARRFWATQDPIGKRISVSGPNGPWLEIVGVTQDGHYIDILDDTLPFFFLPLSQNPQAAAIVHVRSRGSEPSAMVPVIRSVVREVSPHVPVSQVHDVTLLGDVVGIGLLPQRLAASWLGVFGAIALLLAAIGLYGVLRHAVSSRRREIGLRMAVGASPRAIVSLFLSQGLRVVAIGFTIGLAAALVVTRLLSSLLYEVSPTDPITFIATSVILAMVAFAATYLPAQRAARLDPIRVLRQE